MKMLKYLCLIVLVSVSTTYAQKDFQKDVINTTAGPLEITFIGHGTLMFRFGNLIFHIDPVSRYADYSKLPKADIVLITHQHGDHFDKSALEQITTPDTKVVVTEKIAEDYERGIVMKNWQIKNLRRTEIQAVPAYNVEHKRSNGEPFHPKGEGNGYVIKFGNSYVYVAGDTENVKEIDQIKQVDIAFLPMNLPYTMTPQMVADAAIRLQPQILYPYHYGDTDPNELLELLKNEKNIKVRIRDLK
jgi:L-ascorbate metabolism protein UlaG (beta-lactamase superfamily)